MKDITAIIGLWPDVETFARDAGTTKALVAVWRCRGAVPYARIARLERAAMRRKIAGFSTSDLVRLAEKRIAPGDSK